MSKILDVLKTAKGVFVYCSTPDTDFMGAASIEFREGSKNFVPRKFRVGKKYQCFGGSRIAPVIKLEEEVPENFLQQGNEVIFSF